MNLDKKLQETEYIKRENWVKLVHVLKHQFNDWTLNNLCEHGYADFKMVYMPVLMNIKLEGTNNNDLANHARVTKQAMSKVAKELQELGYIKSKADPNDKRSSIFTLTERGKKLVLEARLLVKDLMDEYRSVIGKAEFDKATQVILKILDYNDQQLNLKK